MNKINIESKKGWIEKWDKKFFPPNGRGYYTWSGPSPIEIEEFIAQVVSDQIEQDAKIIERLKNTKWEDTHGYNLAIIKGAKAIRKQE